MEKINLSVQRSFSDLITVTINFMKQEFVPFIRAFAVIGFPMILLMLFFMKDLLMGVFDMSLHPEAYYDVNNFGDTMLRTLFTSLFGVLMMLWVQLFAISYLRVYWDHYQAGIEERITIIEVFRVMLRKFGVYLVWSVFCGLVVLVCSRNIYRNFVYFRIIFADIKRQRARKSYYGINGYGKGKLVEDFRVYSRDVLVGRCCGLSVWYSLYVCDDVVGFHGGDSQYLRDYFLVATFLLGAIHVIHGFVCRGRDAFLFPFGRDGTYDFIKPD